MSALVIVPVFFDPHTVRNFDADKILLFRSIAVLMTLGLIVLSLEGRRAYMTGPRGAGRNPVVVAMTLLTTAYCLSAAFSIAPHISWWGGYFRLQGAYTWLGYAAVFAAIAMLCQRRSQIDRLVNAMLLASVPVALYALIQYAGSDPYDWAPATVGRVASTIGNPIFLGAFMIMVVPLTLARLIGRAASSPEDGPKDHAQTLACLLLLALQIFTIVSTRSRGPLLGLVAGLVVFGLACAARYRTRWMKLAVAGAALFSVVGLLVVAFPSDRPVLSRAAGTVQVRLLIWQGVGALLAANPGRSIFGYGPDTFALAYEPFYPPELAGYEDRTTPDRAHNDTFDALVMTGLVGGALQLLFFASVFYCILQRLRLVGDSRRTGVFAAALLVACTLGAGVPCVVDGSLRFAGIGLGAGVIAGLVLYLAGCVIQPDDGDGFGQAPDALLLAALLAGCVANFVELQVGIATVSTRLYLAAFAALASVIGAGAADRDLGARSSPGPVFGGTVVGLLLIVLTYEFSVPSPRLDEPLLWLFLGTWIVGFVLLAGDPSQSPRPHRLKQMRDYAFFSGAIWLPFVLVHLAWIQWEPLPGKTTGELLTEIADHVGHTVTFLYVFILAIICLPPLFVARRDRGLVISARPPAFRGFYLIALVGAVALVISVDLNGARADAYARLAQTFDREGRFAHASVLYDAAQGLQPRQERYVSERARVLTAQVGSASDGKERIALLREALAAAEQARAANPLNPTHSMTLARVHRVWATQVVEPGEESRHRALGDSYYREASESGPRRADLWREWATLDLERQRTAEALGKLETSLRLDHDPETAKLIERIKSTSGVAGNAEEK